MIAEREFEVVDIEKPLHELLATGCDSRLTIDPRTGTNKYSCSTVPRPSIVPFGSCTASDITERGYAAAGRMLDGLRAVRPGPELDSAIEELARQIRAGIRSWLTHQGMVDVDVVLMPSGTDAELMACFLSAFSHDADICNIVVGPTELGSGSPQAAGGLHFDSLTPGGRIVSSGMPVNDAFARRIDVCELVVRGASGNTRPIEEIDEEVSVKVAHRIEKLGQRVLLHVTAHSKTGDHAPSLNQVAALSAHYADRIDVVVDAAQGRFSRRGLIRILRKGYVVIITGSKFFGGPAFSGALLVPRQLSVAVRHGAFLPKGFDAFVSRSQLPSPWRSMRESLPAGQHNVGLLLRWSAALEEMRSYYETPLQTRLAVLDAFERMMSEIFDSSPAVRADTNIAPLVCGDHADLLQPNTTVFMFRLWNSVDRRYFSLNELKVISRWMDADLSAAVPDASAEQQRALATRLQIGQPVQVSRDASADVSALRIANGAVMVTSVSGNLQFGNRFAERVGWLEDQRRNARLKLETIADNFETIRATVNRWGIHPA